MEIILWIALAFGITVLIIMFIGIAVLISFLLRTVSKIFRIRM